MSIVSDPSVSDMKPSAKDEKFGERVQDCKIYSSWFCPTGLVYTDSPVATAIIQLV